jgi:hypothetical protein
LKDLKAKVAALEEKDKEKDGSSGASNADLTALSAAELRTRLKSSELERARGRNRLQVLKDKITELVFTSTHSIPQGKANYPYNIIFLTGTGRKLECPTVGEREAEESSSRSDGAQADFG